MVYIVITRHCEEHSDAAISKQMLQMTLIASQTLATEVKAAAEPQGSVVVDSDVDDEPLKIAVTRL